MEAAAVLILLTFGSAVVASGFGIAAVVRGRVRVTRRREWVGTRARLVGVAYTAASGAYWWWLDRLWLSYDR